MNFMKVHLFSFQDEAKILPDISACCLACLRIHTKQVSLIKTNENKTNNIGIHLINKNKSFLPMRCKREKKAAAKK